MAPEMQNYHRNGPPGLDSYRPEFLEFFSILFDQGVVSGVAGMQTSD